MWRPRDISESSVTAIILNTDRRDDTLACLASLRATRDVHLDTLVLDNASMDGSVEAIGRVFPEVDVLQLPRNLGYAGNNNIGIHAALGRGADWILIMNEDVVVAPDALTRMLKAAEKDARIGIVGPMVYHHHEPAVIQSAGGMLDRKWRSQHRGLNEEDVGQYASVEEVDWVSGCALLARRAVVEEVGALDDRFFYYWEETELCLRARRAGWKVLFVPEAKIWHRGVQRDYQPGPNVTYYWTRNWLLMLAKHRAPLGAWLAALGWIVRNSFSWSLPKWRPMRGHRQAMWEGALDFFRRRWGMRPT